jgi:hypothetical protein
LIVGIRSGPARKLADNPTAGNIANFGGRLIS